MVIGRFTADAMGFPVLTLSWEEMILSVACRGQLGLARGIAGIARWG